MGARVALFALLTFAPVAALAQVPDDVQAGTLSQHDVPRGPAMVVGFSDDDNVLTFSGTVTGASVRPLALQVEVKPVGVPFDGVTDVFTGDWVASGQVSTVTVGGFADGGWQWRARTVDTGAASPSWTYFGGNVSNPPSALADADFVVRAVTPPDVLPAGVASQHDQPGGATLAAGAIDDDNVVVFQARVTDPDGGPVALQVELKPVTQPFDGTTLVFTGTFVVAGGTSRVEVGGIADGSYQWRARATDGSSVSTAWTDFGGNASNPPSNPAAVDFGVRADRPPHVIPSGQVSQHDHSASGAGLPVGFVDDDGELTFVGSLRSGGAAGPRQLALQVEVKHVGTPFDGVSGLFTGAFTWGVAGDVEVGGLTAGAYQWRARVTDGQSVSAAWTDFGGNVSNPPASPAADDFSMGFPAPVTITGLEQEGDASGAVPAGHANTTSDEMTLAAHVTAPSGQYVALEVELKLVGAAFDGVSGLFAGNQQYGSGRSYVSVRALPRGAYQWRARAVSSTSTSAWTDFGGNASNPPAARADTDFEIAWPPPSATNPSPATNPPPPANPAAFSGGGGGGGCSLAPGPRRDGGGAVLVLLTLLVALTAGARVLEVSRGRIDRFVRRLDE